MPLGRATMSFIARSWRAKAGIDVGYWAGSTPEADIEACPLMTQSRHHVSTSSATALSPSDALRRCQLTAGCGEISAVRTATTARDARKAWFAEFSSEARRRS
jgi:hypothetical protein